MGLYLHEITKAEFLEIANNDIPTTIRYTEVKEPHGDLIDNEDVGEVLEMLEKYEDIDKDTLDIVMSMLWKIPTVIEAED